MGKYEVIRNRIKESADKLADNTLRTGVWEVFYDYRLHTPPRAPETGPKGRYIEAPLTDAEVDVYEPLASFPGLFLEFARLPEAGGLDWEPANSDKNAQVALDWAQSRGVLGLTPTKHAGRVEVSTLGGNGDTVEAFAREAWIAYDTLMLYEATTNPDGPDVETISRTFVPPRGVAATPEMLQERALIAVASRIAEYTSRYCYQTPYMLSGERMIGYDFVNLLGAMWWQMLWLWGEDEPRRCRNPKCRKVITMPEPELKLSGGPRKVRADRQFCIDSDGKEYCKNRYVYLTRTKPRRQREREERKAHAKARQRKT